MTIDEYGEITTPFIRTQFNYNMNDASIASGLRCTDDTRTQQQFVDECDINTIVERFGLTGELPNNLKVPMVGDFTEVYDYQTSLELLREADSAFMAMPAAIRERFNHDPGAFVDFVSDPANAKQCKEWGLARPEEAPRAPIEVRVIPDPSGELKTP